MAEPIGDPAYWRGRLDEATKAGEPHQAIWNTSAAEFGRVAFRHAAILRKLIEPDHSVLDVGCGTGRLLGLLPPDWRGDYLGIDLSPDFVRLARERWPARRNQLLVCDVTRHGIPLRLLPDREVRWDWAVLIGFESMFKKHLGVESWPPVERKIKAAAANLLVLDFTRGWRAECYAEEFLPYGYEGRVTFANPDKAAKLRVTVEVDRGKMTGDEITAHVGSMLDAVTILGRSGNWLPDTQEVRYGREVWLPRESADPTADKEQP